jgi:hypothetical protein
MNLVDTGKNREKIDFYEPGRDRKHPEVLTFGGGPGSYASGKNHDR